MHKLLRFTEKICQAKENMPSTSQDEAWTLKYFLDKFHFLSELHVLFDKKKKCLTNCLIIIISNPELN